MATAFMGYTNNNSPKSYNNLYKLNNNNFIQKRYISYNNKEILKKDITKPEDLFKEICIEPEI
ncbi:hypothetical protein GCM10010275_72700 [Streptomyces litmocidini]|nr:hypothetical protein GCM10010233_65940 [Streptomyces gancidicus]GGV21059.1 hypothetical protein GCM10010275_72700 [Streptomyces litmocidini]GGX40005.1 hypothetical protein GCM10010297_69020 [Streptomyces malachitofuscus]